MKITFCISGSLDITTAEVIEIIREMEHVDKEKFSRSLTPETAASEPKPEPNTELWIGKTVKLNSSLTEEDIKNIGYDDFKKEYVVIKENAMCILIREGELENTEYWHLKSVFELVKVNPNN